MSAELTTQIDTISGAEIRLESGNFSEDLPFFLKTLGFRLDTIFPADDPAVAVISGHGVRIRLEREARPTAGVVRLLCDAPNEFAGGRTELVSPGGTKVEIVDANPPLVQPETQHSFMVRRLKDSDSWIIGRAGMRYRDLIPDRLGGSIIASHIRIPDGGPVPDMVHYHTVGFQLIFCYRGWVEVVYEDQGQPIRMTAGDCVIQPPEIRHRVLVASDNVEVVEIGVPAEHVTTIDHEMTLPNETINPDRVFKGTRFVFDKVAEAVWKPWRIPGFEARDTGIGAATAGVAGVQVARPLNGHTPPRTSHNTDIHFTFVMEGALTLCADGEEPYEIIAGDAFVLPPHLKVAYRDCTEDCELLEITLPADFETDVAAG
ncbi:MAG: cupin domain-containing protein [Pseudomonadota bacterium]